MEKRDIEIVFRCFDDKGSTFSKEFEEFKDALDHYKNSEEPNQPCSSGLDVVVYEDGVEIASRVIIAEHWYWEDGELKHITEKTL